MLQENASLKELIDTFQEIDKKIVNRGGARTIVPSATNQVLEKGYYKGDITIIGDTNLNPKNIKKGVSLFGVVGNSEEGILESIGWKNIQNGESVDTIKKGDAIIFEQIVKGESSFKKIHFGLQGIMNIYGDDSVKNVAISPDNNFMIVAIYSSSRDSRTVFLKKNANGEFEKLPNPGIIRGENIAYLKFSSSSKNFVTATCDYYDVPNFSTLSMYYINNENEFLKVALPTPKRKKLQTNGTFTFNDSMNIIAISELRESGYSGVGSAIEIYEFYNSRWNLVFENEGFTGMKFRTQGDSIGNFIMKFEHSKYVLTFLKNERNYIASHYNEDSTIYEGFGDWIGGNNYIASKYNNNFLKLYTVSKGKLSLIKTFKVSFNVEAIYRTIWENYFILKGDKSSYLFKIKNNELIEVFQFTNRQKDKKFSMSENYIAVYGDYYFKTSVDLYKYFINKEDKFEVKPLRTFDPNLKFNNQKIGVALEESTKGQQIKVNIFDKIKL